MPFRCFFDFSLQIHQRRIHSAQINLFFAPKIVRSVPDSARSYAFRWQYAFTAHIYLLFFYLLPSSTFFCFLIN